MLTEKEKKKTGLKRMGFEQKDQRQANMGRVDEVGGGDFKSATGG